ncbi:MAG TPA: bacterial transcriptional activator domain-containing protein [Nannocystaceae bacterium]|nr:bacterial transcriptional activator domain-containing protein [Nannocystaceae bacterium]
MIVRLRTLACATVTIPALVIVPLAGIDGGFHSAVKLGALLVMASRFAIAARRCRDLTLDEALLAAFALLAILSTGSRLADGAGAIGCAIALFVIVRSTRVCMRGRWDLVEDAVACAAAVTAGIAVLELVGVRLPWAELRRPESTIGNRNQLAGLLVIALPVLVGAVMRRRSFAAPITVLVVTVVVATHCRSAYLAALVAVAIAAVLWVIHLRRTGAAIDRIGVVAAIVALGIVLGALPWPGVSFDPSVLDSAARVFEYESGSGHARLVQHQLGFAALADDPLAWLTGFGAGSWERVAASHAHDFGGHAPKLTSGAMPNSDLLRILVEQGLVGLAAIAAVVVSQLRRPGDDFVARTAAIASLVAAVVLAAFDPQLVRPERIALLGVVLGASARSPRVATLPHRAVEAIVMVACAFAWLRVASYAASSRIGVGGSTQRWEERQALAQQLFPRASLDERRAVALALRDRCDEADDLLRRFLATHPHHWGARVELAQCFARIGRTDDARRLWNDAVAVEPHVRELLVSDAGNLR